MFEYDSNKSRSNKEKHGLDFKEAQAIWQDLNRVEVDPDYRLDRRYMIIGTIDNKRWSAIVTYRGENTRIISVRRSRPNEVKLYGN